MDVSPSVFRSTPSTSYRYGSSSGDTDGDTRWKREGKRGDCGEGSGLLDLPCGLREESRIAVSRLCGRRSEWVRFGVEDD